ncbi:hypothetical protein [Mycobacterium avium]|uniref:hypothetical protein n=1 Tax=Mycobacterium avium TaxID=1764 RepID=UPI001F2660F3|nr:hypothetical protein [Mycobacterium avium]
MIEDDPFASPPDEAQAEPVEDQTPEDAFSAPPAEEPPAPTPPPAKKAAAKKAPAKAVATAKVDIQPNVLPIKVDGDGKIVVTFKGGTGFDAPWIVIHATSVEDALNQVSGENATKLAKLMERTQIAGQHFAGLSPKPQGGGNGGGGGQRQQRQSAPQAAQEAPNGEKRYCAHGEMKFRSGTSKAGKAYQAFFCNSGDRNDECRAQFLR